MEYNLTSQPIHWWLLVLISYSLVLQRIAIYFRRHPKLSINISNGLLILAAVALLIGGYNGFQTWRYNESQAAQARTAVAKANQHAIAANNQPQALVPKAVPSTIQPSASTIADYQVAPSMPRYLVIPKLQIQARVLSVGITGDGSVGTPGNVFDTAWYNQSAPLGQPGATLIDGHISSWTSPGVFYNLNELKSGDTIEVQRGDGRIFTYVVSKTVVYGSSSVDMRQVLNPVVAGKSGLNLMSCFGSVASGTNDFNKRIVVYATLSQ